MPEVTQVVFVITNSKNEYFNPSCTMHGGFTPNMHNAKLFLTYDDATAALSKHYQKFLNASPSILRGEFTINTEQYTGVVANV